MRIEGTVKSVSEGLCEVVVVRETACGESCASCGGGCKQKNQICRAVNDMDAKPGDRVVIEMDSKTVLMWAFLVYIFPLISFICAFFAITQRYTQLTAALAASAAAVIIYVILSFADKHMDKKYISRVVEII